MSLNWSQIFLFRVFITSQVWVSFICSCPSVWERSKVIPKLFEVHHSTEKIFHKKDKSNWNVSSETSVLKLINVFFSVLGDEILSAGGSFRSQRAELVTANFLFVLLEALTADGSEPVPFSPERRNAQNGQTLSQTPVCCENEAKQHPSVLCRETGPAIRGVKGHGGTASDSNWKKNWTLRESVRNIRFMANFPSRV